MLWEIHRLRAIALRTNQLFERLVELGIESKLDPATKLLTEGLSDALRGSRLSPKQRQPGRHYSSSSARRDEAPR